MWFFFFLKAPDTKTEGELYHAPGPACRTTVPPPWSQILPPRSCQSASSRFKIKSHTLRIDPGFKHITHTLTHSDKHTQGDQRFQSAAFQLMSAQKPCSRHRCALISGRTDTHTDRHTLSHTQTGGQLTADETPLRSGHVSGTVFQNKSRVCGPRWPLRCFHGHADHYKLIFQCNLWPDSWFTSHISPLFTFGPHGCAWSQLETRICKRQNTFERKKKKKPSLGWG